MLKREAGFQQEPPIVSRWSSKARLHNGQARHGKQPIACP